MEHTCDRPTPVSLFCDCGKLIDRDGLRSVKLAGFTGPASLNPKMEQFWETGDPSVFGS